MTSPRYWTIERSSGVVTATLDHPPRNFLTFDVLAELGAIIAAAEADPDARALLLRSGVTGRFVTHADLDELAALSDGPVEGARHWYATLRAVERCELPVIAAVDGQAWGGGLELLLCCTILLASPRAHFSLPETCLGIIPGAGGSQRLPNRIGRGRAAEMILTGRVVSAQEAYRIGLVDRLIDDPAFDAASRELAGRIAARPRDVVVAAKRCIDEAKRWVDSDGLRREGQRFAALLASEPSRTLRQAARALYADAEPSSDVTLNKLSTGEL